MMLLMILIFVMLGSLCSVGAAACILFFEDKRTARYTRHCIPFAIGTLLGAAFLGMLPQAARRLPVDDVFFTLLCGIILFFVLEKAALWRHCHEENCDTHSRAGELILLGDSFHNFVDGVAIAVAFSQSAALGIGTAVAVIMHEVPQEVGDFVILLESGYSRSRALWFNALSSGAALPGAILAYYLSSQAVRLVPYFLALSAASFIYIALADLVPGRRSSGGQRVVAAEVVLMLLGISTIALLRVHG